MKTIIATTAGLLAGLALSVGAATAQQAPAQHDYEGNGFYVDCYGNGAGGKRTCEVHVIQRPGAPVHRMNVDLYKNNTFEIGIQSWGYNGGKDREDPLSDQTLDDFIDSRVVR